MLGKHLVPGRAAGTVINRNSRSMPVSEPVTRRATRAGPDSDLPTRARLGTDRRTVAEVPLTVLSFTYAARPQRVHTGSTSTCRRSRGLTEPSTHPASST
jgi:hypothetical protein